MKKFTVFGVLSASTRTFETEANNPEEAAENFFESDEASSSLCHYCSKEVELGEVYQTLVYDEEGNEVYNDAEKKIFLHTVLKLLKSDKSKEEILLELEQ